LITRSKTLDLISRYSIPKGTLAVLANVSQPYVSNFCSGRNLPPSAEDRIHNAAIDIANFIEHVRGFGFSPDLTNGSELAGWISRWKQRDSQAAVCG